MVLSYAALKAPIAIPFVALALQFTPLSQLAGFLVSNASIENINSVSTVGSEAQASGDGLVAGISAGPLGVIVLGIEIDNHKNLTWDCWKKVLRDESPAPSQGKMLRDILTDNRIKLVKLNKKDELVLCNIWNELFDIEFYFISSVNQIVAHACKIDNY